MNYRIALIKGDGVGPEVIDEAVKILKVIGEKFNHSFEFIELFAGGVAIDTFGKSLPKETIEKCRDCDSILLGAVGGYKWDSLDDADRPEKALLALREKFNLYTNLRPVILYSPLKDASPLKDEIVKNGINIMVVRELTGGIYFGKKGAKEDVNGVSAFDVEQYNEEEIKRIATSAFEIARKRNKKVTSVDKANVLESSKLWRKVVSEISKSYADIQLNHMYIDNASMQLVRDPSQFDVILTTNMFGDILSDEASQLTGSIGMLPSASTGNSKFGMYEPIHGSAPDIAGKNIANPIGAILSVAMMLEQSFEMLDEAKLIKNSVNVVLENGYRTKDIMEKNTTLLGTKEMGSLICEMVCKEG